MVLPFDVSGPQISSQLRLAGDEYREGLVSGGVGDLPNSLNPGSTDDDAADAVVLGVIEKSDYSGTVADWEYRHVGIPPLPLLDSAHEFVGEPAVSA